MSAEMNKLLLAACVVVVRFILFFSGFAVNIFLYEHIC